VATTPENRPPEDAPPEKTSPSESFSSGASDAQAEPASPTRRSPYYDDDDYAPRRGRMYNVFPPLLLLFVATVAWPVFQCWQLVAEKGAIATIYTNQTKPFDDASKMRVALEGIARDTALLAAQGHTGAKMIVDELAKRGVKIDPNATPSTPPSAPK
jgi:hypothetical protein